MCSFLLNIAVCINSDKTSVAEAWILSYFVLTFCNSLLHISVQS